MRQDFRKQDCAPELHGLIDTVKKIRQKILANIFLEGWAVWTSWILIGLLAVFAISARFGMVLILAGGLAAAGAAFLLIWTWRTRLSTYQTACRVDAAARLQDRVSTAIFLGDSKNPGGMIERQRGDALSRIGNVEWKGLFPLRMSAAERRALVLLLAAGGLFVYRIHHQPPLTALFHLAARSPLVQSVLSPLVNRMENDLQRAVALVTSKPDALGNGAAPDQSTSSHDDLWQSNNDKNADAKETQPNNLEGGEGDAPQEQLQTPRDQNSSQSSDSWQQENSGPQSQNGKNPGESPSSNSQKASEMQSQQKPGESLSQSLMRALKNMMASSPNQQSRSREGRQPSADGAQQSGNTHQPGDNESDKKGDSRGNSDSKDNPTQTASNGAGSQPGLKGMKKDLSPAHPVNAVPDRVALESSGFKDQTRMRIDTDTGTSQLALRNQNVQSGVVINGAEQENIPPRYRLYVQRYFEHADDQKR
ncbi:MAG: hypothetical protein ACRD4Y_15690 [Candidatus Acidiferrales bacterium]